MPTLEKYKEKILGFWRRKKRMPSYGEIAELLEFKSKNAAYKLVRKLVDLGALAKDASGRIVPKSLATLLPVIGVVEAGWPSPAEEELLDTLTLDQFLIGNREATYILKVTGDSMIEAGIMPGDHVLVERGGEPKDGDIVIAEVDGAWTMKYFRKRGKQVMLVAANKKYKPIVPQQELRVAAIVKSSFRKY